MKHEALHLKFEENLKNAKGMSLSARNFRSVLIAANLTSEEEYLISRGICQSLASDSNHVSSGPITTLDLAICNRQ